MTCEALSYAVNSGSGADRLAVVALGGNALLQRGQPLTMEIQQANAARAAASLASVVEELGLALCVTHGNGPQVGLLAEQSPETPMDVLGAESEGQIGYLVELELGNRLPSHQLVALITKTVVDPSDPAFKTPTKPIGPMYSKEDADKLTASKGWTMAADGPTGFRRVVASPAPIQIQEAPAVKLLLQNGIITICCGGGGVPIAQEAGRGWKGVEAVIDKDAASALLAKAIKADVLLLLTDAPAIFDPHMWPQQRQPLASPCPVDQLRAEDFATGSMRPKVAAALDFVRSTGGVAGIGALDDAVDILRGRKGTLIVQGGAQQGQHQRV